MSKIYHFTELEEFFGEGEWKLQIDVTDLWNQYNEKKINLVEFNNKYHDRLLEYKEDIFNLGEDVWKDLEDIMGKMKERVQEDELLPVYDDIYSWGDKNDVLIKTK